MKVGVISGGKFKGMIVFSVIFAIFCTFFFCEESCEAGEREDKFLHYFTEDVDGRFAVYKFLEQKLHADEVEADDANRAIAVMGRVQEAANDHHWFYLLIVPEEKFNAYSLPGGIFIINKKVLDTLSDDELAAILAHEMGHYVHGDPVKALKRSPLASRYLSKAAKSWERAENGDTSYLEHYWEAMQLSLVVKREERETDEWAAEIIAKGDFDIDAVINLWPYLEELYGPVPNGSNHLTYKERRKIYAAAKEQAASK